MINKMLNVVGVMLLGFTVSYMVSAVFDGFGLSPNIIINALLIISITVFIIITLRLIIHKLFESRHKADN
ncbi:hypothetical protein [Virgibacillus sp. YIM 98842]|uniref:hypothetical protein n=1 Tax=Virgibacillus sp. YIM 98842 TaxID=2663533 RepID=UPI0013DB3F26|nr:hypothetical protein [Virgibacillus sp. YIM 98842]